MSVANANFQECNNEFFKSGCEQCGKTHKCSLLDSGDVVYRIKEETLRERGVLTEYKVFLLALEQDPRSVLASTYAAYQKAMIFNNKIRDNIVVLVVKMCQRCGFKTLLMFQSVDHGRHISELTGCTFIHGDRTC